ncbi:hypothetical protein [Saccharopolyspora griseoalba]|uniref:Uncharacterized protein n=1 Tax=Saccharopolyspora griseoalba TaxID=1431848 RepID=A0ABW2LRQ0_9PSEU
MRNLTQFPITFQTEGGGEFTVPVDKSGPAFRPIRRSSPAGAVTIRDRDLHRVEIPVEDQELGDVDLPSTEPVVVPIPTAQHLAGQANVFVPHGVVRDDKGQIQGYTGLARVVEALAPTTSASTVKVEELKELEVLTPHAAAFYLDGPDNGPALTIQSTQSDPSIGRQEEQVTCTAEVVETEHGVLPVSELRYGKVNLPDPAPGVGLVVSRITAGAAAGRGDLLVPVTVAKNGRPIGASGLNRIR